MKIGVEAVDLEGILDIVSRYAVAIVIGVQDTRCSRRCRGIAGQDTRVRRQGIAAQDVRVDCSYRRARTITESPAGRAQICLLCQERRIEAGTGWNAILPWAHIKLPDHTHLQVLGRRDMAVPEISAGIDRKSVV